MTYRDLYNEAKSELKAANIEAYEYETSALIEYIFGLNKTSLIIRYDDNIYNEALIRDFLKCLKRRICGEPLQYITGYTDFYGRRFFVGKGVLIPRFDTEVLIDEVLSRLNKTENPNVIDLCSGSGAIAITLSKELENGAFYAAELSDDACRYLDMNKRANSAQNVNLIKGDIFNIHQNFENGFFDAIVSNPPYIKTSEIPTLDAAVLCEPKMALDGGEDGMMFYREIIRKWTDKLKKGGLIALEIDEGQQNAIEKQLVLFGYTEIKTQKDLQGLTRVISAIKNQ
ncbi:MAG: peptide chain release factor N(5)-glutamine methyltransferase [Clostridiales bacterium]|nr:peptide chain release factor N(5)-glutamine methyltransferase [Clostridiales bacterium]